MNISIDYIFLNNHAIVLWLPLSYTSCLSSSSSPSPPVLGLRDKTSSCSGGWAFTECRDEDPKATEALDASWSPIDVMLSLSPTRTSTMAISNAMKHSSVGDWSQVAVPWDVAFTSRCICCCRVFMNDLSGLEGWHECMLAISACLTDQPHFYVISLALTSQLISLFYPYDLFRVW